MWRNLRLEERAKETTMAMADSLMSLVPRTPPTPDLVRNTRIIAHRGAPARVTDENTIDAFENALAAGAWGIEFDIRWTRDHEPIIHHDKNCLRTFFDPHVLEEHPFEVLRTKFSRIPTLREVVERYGRRIHLMVELKRSDIAWSPARIARLAQELQGLRAGIDYHLMSLDLPLLLRCEFATRESLLPIAEFSIEAASRFAIEEKLGGFTGHYALVSERQIRRHRDLGQHVGTGFIGSRSVFAREINRGVDLLFTNTAARLASYAKEALTSAPVGI